MPSPFPQISLFQGYIPINSINSTAVYDDLSRVNAISIGAGVYPFFYSSFPLVFSACPESVGSTDPTILPARKVVLALMYAPLDNHKIAFGCIHFALHLFS